MRDPQSLHKYLYVHGDPIQGVDPTGLQFSVGGLAVSIGIIGTLSTIGLMSAFGPRIDKPSFLGSLLPVIGPSREAIHQFQNGHPGFGILFSLIAVADWFLVGSLFKLATRFLVSEGAGVAARGGAEVLISRTTQKGAAGIAGESLYRTGADGVAHALVPGKPWLDSIRSLLGFQQGSGLVRWEGAASQLFGPVGISGVWTGLKRTLGHYTTHGVGNVKLLSFTREGNTLIVTAAEIISKGGGAQVVALVKNVVFHQGIDFLISRTPAAILDDDLSDWWTNDIRSFENE